MNILKFIVSISLCFSVAFLGSVFTFSSISTWYAQLNKPFFNPPDWIFGPVWTILYFLMAIAFYIVWDKDVKNKTKEQAIQIFLFQLALNLLWSLVFFGFQNPLLALVVIIALWLSIFMTIKYLYKLAKIAAYLLVPYILWVSFASILNFAIVILN